MPIGVLPLPGPEGQAGAALVLRLLGGGAFSLRGPDAPLPDDLDALIVVGGAVGEWGLGQGGAAFAAGGGPVLGLAAGFAALCQAGLLPGCLSAVALEARAVHLRVEGKPTPFTGSIPAGRVLALAPGAMAWRYEGADAALGARGQVIARFCDEAGGVRSASDPTGSAAGIAGICSPNGNVVGLLAGPELLVEREGRQILAALALHLSRRRRAVAPRRPVARARAVVSR